MTKVTMPEPITTWYDEIDKVEYQCITTTQAQAYADARVKEALEEAAKVPRAYAMDLDKQGWGKRFPDELTAIFNATPNMEWRIRALIPPTNPPA